MKIIIVILATLFFSSNKVNQENKKMSLENIEEKAIFAGGCFWCTEAVFLQLEGVKQIKPGYIGGKNANPTYEEVCSGYSGHAEAVEIIFDANTITYQELLEVFFATHDPTTINRQGNDVGSQYRSEIFYTNEAQNKTAKEYILMLNDKNVYGKKVVTKISNASTFYVAENYHLNYYNLNKNKSYCEYVITPKIEKVKKEFKEKLKKEF
jgi:peptide-methionine (S)-S-oxide reductase